MTRCESAMTEADSRRFKKLVERYSAGEHADALDELHSLVESVSSPVDKAGLLYHEVLWRLELGDVRVARTRFEEMRHTLVACGIVGPPPDNGRADLTASLGFMTLFAEASLLTAEGEQTQALTVFEDLVSPYKKQLNIKKFRNVRGEILTRFGMLLGNTNRWLEAGPLLEQATPPKELQPVLSYYLGQYYYTIRDYERAAKKLKVSFTDSMPPKWRCGAHFMKGVCEYHLHYLEAAKRDFELSTQSADATDVRKYNIWGWLEAVCRVLGMDTEAEKYHAKAVQAAVN